MSAPFKRIRKNPYTTGLSSPNNVEDAEARRRIAELQEAVRDEALRRYDGRDDPHRNDITDRIKRGTTQEEQPLRFSVNPRIAYMGDGRFNVYASEAIYQDGQLTIMPERLEKTLDTNAAAIAAGVGGGTGSGTTTTIEITSYAGFPVAGV